MKLESAGWLRGMPEHHHQKHSIKRDADGVAQQIDQAGYIYSTHILRTWSRFDACLLPVKCKVRDLLLQQTTYFRPAS